MPGKILRVRKPPDVPDPPYAGDNIPFKLNEHSSVGYPRMQGKF